MKEVVILQETMRNYRVPFFDLLREQLASEAIRLRVVYGKPGHNVRGDEADLAWGEAVATRELGLRSKRLTHMDLPDLTHAQLIIVEHATHLLPLTTTLFGRQRAKVCLWGHAGDWQAGERTGERLNERAKRALARRARWWFVYTSEGAERLVGWGVPRSRITVVHNSVDVPGDVMRVPAHERPRAVGFLGTFREEKGIELLPDIAARLARADPPIKLRVAGSGPGEGQLREALLDQPNVDWLGRVDDDAKRDFLNSVAALVVPRMVGLVAVEALASGTPIVTPKRAGHSPEIEYLQDGWNARLVDSGEPAALAEALTALIDDAPTLQQLAGAAAAWVPSISEMVDNFACGIVSALAA